MTVLPQDTVLGPLEVGEIFDIFDFPRLLLARNPFGACYLALSVEEREDELVWLYLPLRKSRLQELDAGHLSLRSAFAEPEDLLLKVVCHADGRNEVSALHEAPPEWLPEEGERLRIHEPEPVPAEPSRALAQSGWRDVIQTALAFPRFEGPTAPLRPLGEFLSNFQQVVDAVGASLLDHTAARGSIPRGILDRTELQVAGTFAGSFGTTLTTVSRADLFGASLAGHSMELFLRVVNLALKAEELTATIREHGPRVATRLRVLYETLESARATANISWTPPSSGRGGSAFLSREAVTSTLSTLTALEASEAEELPVTGRLIGVNIRTKSYELRTESERRYSGRVAEAALSDVSHATINERYSAVVRVLLEVNTSTGEENIRYLLTSLRPLRL